MTECIILSSYFYSSVLTLLLTGKKDMLIYLHSIELPYLVTFLAKFVIVSSMLAGRANRNTLVVVSW